MRLPGWEKGSQLAQALPDPSASREAAGGCGSRCGAAGRAPGPRLSQPGRAPGSLPQGLGLSRGDTEGPGLEMGPGGQDFQAEVPGSPGEFGLPDSAPTLKSQGWPGLTHVGTGCFQANQGCVVWERGMGTGSKEVCPDPALSRLPRPCCAPGPAVGGPSNADPGLLHCSRQNRL